MFQPLSAPDVADSSMDQFNKLSSEAQGGAGNVAEQVCTFCWAACASALVQLYLGA